MGDDESGQAKHVTNRRDQDVVLAQSMKNDS